MMLLADIGNSRIKSALVRPGHWQSQAPVAHQGRWHAAYERAWATLPRPAAVHVCCVAGVRAEEDLERFCRERWKLVPAFFRSASETLGIVNHYRNPGQLGADRWAALLGARACAPGWVCVVDCGTAITVDVLSAQNHYIGGAILPGPTLIREALRQGTGLVLDVRTVGGADLFLGLDTAECVASGLRFGLAGAIDRLLSEVKRRLHLSPVVLLTGGTAEQWAPLLAHAARIEPELVLRGLARAVGLAANGLQG